MVTNLAGIGWIYTFKSNTNRCCFVLNKLLQLVKAPFCHHALKVFVPCLCPCANIFKLFESDYSDCVPFSQTSNNTPYGTHCKISRKTQRISEVCIAKLIQGNSRGHFLFACYFKNVITSIEKTLACFFENIRNRRSNKFTAYSPCFHSKNHSLQSELNQLTKERGFLPTLKNWVSTSSNG